MNSPTSDQLPYHLTSYRERDVFQAFIRQQADINTLHVTPYNAKMNDPDIHYDFIIRSANTQGNWLTEIKIKKEKSTANFIINPLKGAYLAEKKYNDIIKLAGEHNCRPVYINYFATDHTFIIWFLDTCIKRLDPKCLRQSNTGYFNTNRIEQPTYLLPVKGNSTEYKFHTWKKSLTHWNSRAKNALSIINSDPSILEFSFDKPQTK